MNDMSAVIVPKSDQINADTLLAGPMTVTIREVSIHGGQEQPVSIMLEETPLFYRPCKSMSRVLVQAWGPDAKAYVGRSLTLYRDPSVKWGGLEVGGIRISHMSDIDGKKVMQLTATKGQRKPHIVMPLVVDRQQPSNGNGGNNDAAGKWANQYLAKVATFGTLDALNAFANDKAGRLAELESALPNAHKQCVAALDARRAALSPKSGFDDDLEEGPDQSQRGEGFTDDADPPVWQAKADEIRSMIANALGDASWEAAKAEWLRHSKALPTDVRDALETELAAKRAALAEG